MKPLFGKIPTLRLNNIIYAHNLHNMTLRAKSKSVFILKKSTKISIVY